MSTGGARWGAGRPAYHRKTSYLRSIGVRQLRGEGRLGSGGRVTWAWRDESGKVLSAVGIVVCDSMVDFDYWIDDQPVNQSVVFVKTACHYGGERTWFLCPCCGRRCAHVYFGSQVACRTCHRLKYPSQSDDGMTATWRAQRKLEARLGGENYWRKPKGMHETTFRRIRQQITELESKRNRLLYMSLIALGVRFDRK